VTSVVRISIVIVAYKSADEIGACLDSIPSHAGEYQIEVIVVDNAPGDGTERVVQARAPAALYLPMPDNPGFGRGNNLGFARSSGDVILFLNPDTVVNERALLSCVERLMIDAQIGLISPRLVLPTGHMDAACRRSIPNLWDGFCRAMGLSTAFPGVKWFGGYNLSYLPEDGTYDVGAINGAFMMGRREVFEKVGLFDESFFMYGDDLDLCIRMRKAGYRIVYDGRVQITHVKGVSVAKEYDRMSRAIFDANRDVYLKHFNPRGSALVEMKYRLAFGLWKRLALLRARLKRSRRVQPQ
jgi:N-acetylglucosaminyl-diphospho-decaprenol L-rhamnosyltransferase